MSEDPSAANRMTGAFTPHAIIPTGLARDSPLKRLRSRGILRLWGCPLNRMLLFPSTK